MNKIKQHKLLFMFLAMVSMGAMSASAAATGLTSGTFAYNASNAIGEGSLIAEIIKYVLVIVGAIMIWENVKGGIKDVEIGDILWGGVVMGVGIQFGVIIDSILVYVAGTSSTTTTTAMNTLNTVSTLIG